MKLIQYKDLGSTCCPTGGFCRGESCAVFELYPRLRYVYGESYYNEAKAKQKLTDWVPEEISGYTLVEKKVSPDFWAFITKYDLVAVYEQVKEDSEWYCGLGTEG